MLKDQKEVLKKRKKDDFEMKKIILRQKRMKKDYFETKKDKRKSEKP